MFLGLLGISILSIGTFLVSFVLTSSVLAHGNHCGWPNPACNVYYAGQIGDTRAGSLGYSFGIKGGIKAQDLNLYDYSNDANADWIGMTNFASGAQWGQMGFAEGAWPNFSVHFSPDPYFEKNTACDGYSITQLSSVGLFDTPQMWYTGNTMYCNGTTVYKYQVIRFSPQQTIGTFWLPTPSARFDAVSEHIASTHMEPAGIKCFGTSSSCSVVSGLWDLYLYGLNPNQWTFWGSSRPTTILAQGGYYHGSINQYRNFFTYGSW